MTVAEWVSSSSCRDLSGILPVDPVSALVPTSQAGGNMLASNENAMTAPGSQPVDNLQDHQSQVLEDPSIEVSNKAPIAPGTDGKPQASGQASYSAPKPAWERTTVPEITRKAAR